MAISILLNRGSNLEENRQPEMLIQTIPFIVLATLSVIGRFISRRFRKAALGADDYTIVVALILTWGDFAIVVVDTYLGIGKHTEVEPKIYVSQHYMVTFASSIIYATAITVIKLAILLLYQRIFNVPKFILITRIIGAFVVAWWLVVVIIQIFSCRPVTGFWNPSTGPTCINPAHFYIAVAVPNILTDIIMLGLPVRMVWRVQTSLSQKIALSITFLTGGFVIVASIYRIFWLHQANRTDPLWTYTGVAIWTSIEPSVGVVCACLPTLRPLLRELLLQINQVRTVIQSVGNQSQHEHGIKLESRCQSMQVAKFPNQGRWIDNDLKLHPMNNVSGEAAVTSSTLEPDPERDDTLLTGINVQRDVRIDHAWL